MNAAARTANLRQQIARRALDTIRTPESAHILNVVRTGTVVTIATYQADAHHPYCVDSFRLLAPTEKDLEDWAPHQPNDWTLIDQYGGAGADEVPGMLTNAIAFARTVAA